MAHILEYTDEWRRDMIAKGRESTYLFTKFILGLNAVDETPHGELCECLDGRGNWGPWTRGCICWFRGSLKTSVATIGWTLKNGIYRNGWSCRIVGSSWDNAHTNFFEPMLRIFRTGPRRNLLLWMFGEENPEFTRIKGDFVDWNDTQISFLSDNPLAKASVTYKGISSDQEGYHGDAVIFDDPEGADANKSNVENQDSWNAINNATPLLIDPTKGQILVIGTPHGADPVVWKIRDMEANGSLDNSQRSWKMSWNPIVDESGTPAWPGRFDSKAVETIRNTTDRRVFDTQYLLKRTSSGEGAFSKADIERGFYEWNENHDEISYLAMVTDPDKWEKDGVIAPRLEKRTVHRDSLRFYLHIDPVHKEDKQSKMYTRHTKPSRCAIVPVGVAPDFHTFVIDPFTKDLGLEEQVRRLLGMYLKFAPYHITCDMVGAQVWFVDYVRMMERADPAFRYLLSTGAYGEKRILPSMSSKIIEDTRTTRIDKEGILYERLGPWLQYCALHVHRSQDEMLHQLFNFPDNEHVDLVDALAQGPPVWSPGLGMKKRLQREREFKQVAQSRDRITGAIRPYVMPTGVQSSSRLLPGGGND
jgi:hypothetical protein